MTIVRMGLSPRADGLSRIAAQRYWGSEHARLFAQVPGLVSYVQNHAVLDRNEEPLLGDPGFDIHSEVEFADEGEMSRAVSGGYYENVILPDERCLLDGSRRTFLVTRRVHAAGQPQAGAVKLVLFISSPDGPASQDAPHLRPGGTGAVAQMGRGSESHYGIDYVVDRVGGPRIRPIDYVVQLYFRAMPEALRWYERTWPHGPGSTVGQDILHAAAIANEVEVVRRSWPPVLTAR